MAKKTRNEPKRAYILILTAKQAREGAHWTYDFETMSGAGWPEEQPKEARLIFALRGALEHQTPILTCASCRCRYTLIEPGTGHDDGAGSLTCPWCGRGEGAVPPCDRCGEEKASHGPRLTGTCPGYVHGGPEA